VAGRRWETDAAGFWQPHRAAAQTYSQLIARWADASVGGVAVDLYCGVGVFAARMAEQVGTGGQILAVESAAGAVDDGRAALADLPQLRLVRGRVERTTLPQRPDVVVLDPPRSGAGREVVAAVASASPQRIVHVGCDPAAFARDVGLYATQGYSLRELCSVDAFPMTHHVECLALLTR
jgi:tRNA/tmRNA/rRNA uracil-C5-methylase (TrmA/RlmC/RlmD family)